MNKYVVAPTTIKQTIFGFEGYHWNNDEEIIFGSISRATERDNNIQEKHCNKATQ